MSDVYGTNSAESKSLESLVEDLRQQAVEEIYVKELAPNDNSKNQPYFADHYTSLSFINATSIWSVPSESVKTDDPTRQIIFHLNLDFYWMTPNGSTVHAPDANLVYYPQYPEVRFSGFLNGTRGVASEWMNPYKRGRAEGRWLIIGVNDSNRTIGYLATPNSRIAQELRNASFTDTPTVFLRLLDTETRGVVSSKDLLVRELVRINAKGIIPGQKMSKQTGRPEPYNNRNAGGYTLEAEFGIYPNSEAGPDYLGWEIKSFSVKEFPSNSPGKTTLMDHLPDGGLYAELSFPAFVDEYGYPPPNPKKDPYRTNFGGTYKLNRPSKATGLVLRITGFDIDSQKLTRSDGFLGLYDQFDIPVAVWTFASLLEHWHRKHSQTVYVPRKEYTLPHAKRGYQFGLDVEFGEGTTFERLLTSLVNAGVYIEPTSWVKRPPTKKVSSKQRSLFRAEHKDLPALYGKYTYESIA